MAKSSFWVNAAGINRDTTLRKMDARQWSDVITMALAREVARKGVTVNSVSPGYCRTQLVMQMSEKIREDIIAKIPVGRLGEPFEIARAVDFLSAEAAGFITDANLPVNGGYFMD